jgi:hypothetical protein
VSVEYNAGIVRIQTCASDGVFSQIPPDVNLKMEAKNYHLAASSSSSSALIAVVAVVI